MRSFIFLYPPLPLVHEVDLAALGLATVEASLVDEPVVVPAQ